MPKKESSEVIVELDPKIVYFTFSRIRGVFSCGRTIASTRDQFLRHELTPHDLPLLSVLTDGAGNYYSQNNRRLYLYKELCSLGLLQTVPVRLRALPDTRRMREKYTPEKCSLHATLKREGIITSSSSSSSMGQKQKINSEEEDDEEEEEEEEEEKKEKVHENATNKIVTKRMVDVPSSNDENNAKKPLISYNEDNNNNNNNNNNNKHANKKGKKKQQREQQNQKRDGGWQPKTLEEELRELGV
ncbi:uncharacterized protein TM35_000142110 [Trypanosoma theileri]|uniref:Uncharacterized protein n=1 Tax=Trypanosoma theileri TaxID=67003 RepID=A0A1X0NXX3_9TRYP|nr:uncharacterized protein TM35_000142110 [Trypanosoma theileri]ORC89000.1 hypothetical protein TM35_000142110 [Trypanosoma theileri]